MSTKAMTISAAILVFLLALGLTLYPLISNQYNQQHQSRLRRSCVPTVTRGLDLIMKSPLGIKAGKQVRTFAKSFSFL